MAHPSTLQWQKGHTNRLHRAQGCAVLVMGATFLREVNAAGVASATIQPLHVKGSPNERMGLEVNTRLHDFRRPACLMPYALRVMSDGYRLDPSSSTYAHNYSYDSQ